MIYVVYADYGSYEGCQPPQAAFSTKEKAALWIYECGEHWVHNAKIAEVDLDNPRAPEERPTVSRG